MPGYKMMEKGGSVRGKSRAERERKPGVGGSWADPVSKEKKMSDKYGQGTPRPPKKYRDGGMVRGYMDGGEVCRGGGKAISGTKFRGVK